MCATSNERHFTEAAYEQGLPYYTLGLPWLKSGLDTLKADFPDLSEPAEIVSKVARQAETNVPFTTLRLPPAPALTRRP